MVFGRVWFVLLAASAAAWSQSDGAHWGIQGDGGYFAVPSSVVEEIHSLPETPAIDGGSLQVGLVRFNDRGAPSYAFQYSQLNANLEGSLSDARGTASVSGSGNIRGFMATKYVNFFTSDRISGGIALGGGIGKLDGSYTRRVTSGTTTVFSELRSYDYTFPLFEILGRVDFRVAKYLTIGPFYGIRNGMLGGGGSVRIHFLR